VQGSGFWGWVLRVQGIMLLNEERDTITFTFYHGQRWK